MLEIDRWILAELDRVIASVMTAYQAYEFHTVYHTLYNFSTVTLSARYFDIIKDRLYTFAPRNPARRSAQTALYRIADALARLLAPILVFTADEIWENLPGNEGQNSSVHLQSFPRSAGNRDAEILQNWEKIFSVRDTVLRHLEIARERKEIGSSLEAQVTVKASSDLYNLLRNYETDLRYIFIVSQTTLIEDRDLPDGSIAVETSRADGKKCERCWNYSIHVGESSRYPTVCERCVAALEEIENSSS